MVLTEAQLLMSLNTPSLPELCSELPWCLSTSPDSLGEVLWLSLQAAHRTPTMRVL